LVECNCNLCGRRNDKVIFERPDGLRVVQCGSCGLVYLNPRPKDDLIPALYDSNYFISPSSIGFDNYFLDDVRQGMFAASKRRLLVLEEAGITAFDRALEVGCGTGEFCHILHKMGAEVTGIDISESAITEARSRYKTVPFHIGSIENLDPETKYDAVFAYELIEHLTDPNAFFERVSGLLQENGFFCLTTPSFECAERVGFENWIGFSTSLEHLYFFSSSAIGRYASKHGMHVACKLYGGGNGLNGYKVKRSSTREVIRRILSTMHLLVPIRRIRGSMRPIKHNYQSEEIRHNLLMILCKGQ